VRTTVRTASSHFGIVDKSAPDDVVINLCRTSSATPAKNETQSCAIAQHAPASVFVLRTPTPERRALLYPKPDEERSHDRPPVPDRSTDSSVTSASVCAWWSGRGASTTIIAAVSARKAAELRNLVKRFAC
jgi:hypothetical protein